MYQFYKTGLKCKKYSVVFLIYTQFGFICYAVQEQESTEYECNKHPCISTLTPISHSEVSKLYTSAIPSTLPRFLMQVSTVQREIPSCICKK